jgi:acetylornithine deacetylase/succinyl-diaminopimelate desuccinylase-like protein
MDQAAATDFVSRAWEDSIVPQLFDYIRIPNKSPAFDKNWERAGHMDRAVTLIADWCKAQRIDGLQVKVHRLPGRTPLIFMEAPGEGSDCVLLYGHLDKQPEMEGWLPELGPWSPVRKGDKLYGRGGADDGYAAFASLTALRLLQEQRQKRARCVVIIEGCEESGSYDLPFYIDSLKAQIGTPSLVIALDSGCGNYDQLWCTTSLRGLAGGELRVEVLTEGVHSGDASGVVPSSFRVMRTLLSRLEDEKTGEIHKAFHAPIPAQRKAQAKACGKVLEDYLWKRFPWSKNTRPMARDLGELVLNRTWRPYLEIVGMDGVPSSERGGNVLRPYTTAKLSLRLPPTADAERSVETLKQLLTKDPPYGATVTFTSEKAGGGWNAPALAPWLEDACERASQAFYQESCLYMGEGGTIPFMGMLGEKFPEAQFLITGVLGPQSNAHGPNEFLHLPMGKRLTCCVAQVIADHFTRRERAAKPAGAKPGGAKPGGNGARAASGKSAAKRRPGKRAR